MGQDVAGAIPAKRTSTAASSEPLASAALAWRTGSQLPQPWCSSAPASRPKGQHARSRMATTGASERETFSGSDQTS